MGEQISGIWNYLCFSAFARFSTISMHFLKNLFCFYSSHEGITRSWFLSTLFKIEFPAFVENKPWRFWPQWKTIDKWCVTSMKIFPRGGLLFAFEVMSVIISQWSYPMLKCFLFKKQNIKLNKKIYSIKSNSVNSKILQQISIILQNIRSNVLFCPEKLQDYIKCVFVSLNSYPE